MAVGNATFVLLALLVAVHFIFAEENLLEEVYGPDEKISNNDNANEGMQERAYLPIIFNYAYPCRNFTITCVSCTQVARCLAGKTILRNCRGFLRYCNAGRCSPFPSSECSSD